VEGNERVDALSGTRAKMNQKDTIVTHKIVRAKILNRKWTITNPKAWKIFQNRRRPKSEVEKRWLKSVRRKYSQLRSGHTMELRY
jgi:hypothetical protein